MHDKKYVLLLCMSFVLFFLVKLFVQLPASVVYAQKDREEILVGVLANFPPQYSIDKETGKSVGFAIDIMNEVANRSGLKVRYVVFDTWAKVMQAVREGHIDVIANEGITAERKLL